MPSKHLIAVAPVLLLLAFAQPCTAQVSDVVKFRGTVTSDETWGETIGYGSYYVWVKVDEIIEDNNALVAVENTYLVYYAENMGLKIDDNIEVYGMAFFGDAPEQCWGYIGTKSYGAHSDFYVQLPSVPPLHIYGYASVMATISEVEIKQTNIAAVTKIDEVLSYTTGESPNTLLNAGDIITIEFSGIGDKSTWRAMDLTSGDRIKANLRALNSAENPYWECFDENFELVAEGGQLPEGINATWVVVGAVIVIAIVLGFVFVLKKRRLLKSSSPPL